MRVRMMFLLLALTAACYSGEETEDHLQSRSAAKTQAAKPNPARKFHLIKKDLASRIRTKNLAKTPADRTKAIIQLTDLHFEIVTHPKFADSDTLDTYRAKIRSHLLKEERTLKANRKKAAAAKKKAGQGGRAQQDNADELIDLIQATISPDHWDVNGGEATIRYYARKHALVVRASSRVQRNIGQALGNIR